MPCKENTVFDMKRIILLIAAALALFVFFTYKLTEIPSGVTVDESAFGYNAILLSKTLRDENHRFLPVFVLSIHGEDWRQPVTQYFATAMFKIFNPSLYNLRLTATITAIVSTLLIFFLCKRLLGIGGGILAAVFLATTPVIMMQSHLGLDNIAPVPFVIIWLFALYLFTRKKNNFWLIISAVSLGIGYYSYKGMRVFVPTWVVTSLVFLALPFLVKVSKKNFLAVVRPVLFFWNNHFAVFCNYSFFGNALCRGSFGRTASGV